MAVSSKVRLIQHLIDTRLYRHYLEIGAARGRVFNVITVAYKARVDPFVRIKRSNSHNVTSDKFFRSNKTMFDLVFIDGLHEHEQVLRDVHNSLSFLNKLGCLVLHDVFPKNEAVQVRKKPAKGPWTGDVWKAWLHLRATRSDLKMRCIQDGHSGLGWIEVGSQDTIELPAPAGELTYAFYEENKHLMNLVSLNSVLQN